MRLYTQALAAVLAGLLAAVPVQALQAPAQTDYSAWDGVLDSYYVPPQTFQNRTFLPAGENRWYTVDHLGHSAQRGPATRYITERHVLKDGADVAADYRAGHFVEDFVVPTGFFAIPVRVKETVDGEVYYTNGDAVFEDSRYGALMLRDPLPWYGVDLSQRSFAKATLYTEDIDRLIELGFQPQHTRAMHLALPVFHSSDGILFYDGEREAYLPLDESVSSIGLELEGPQIVHTNIDRYAVHSIDELIALSIAWEEEIEALGLSGQWAAQVEEAAERSVSLTRLEE